MGVAWHDELIRSGLLAPVIQGGREEQRWLDCDLASLAEHRLGVDRSPLDLDDAARREWQAKATLEPPMRLLLRERRERCFWILDDGEPRGTVSLSHAPGEAQRVRLASLYVFPDRRSRGTGRRFMLALMERLGRRGLGLSLETLWTWQRAIRFYQRLGMWVSDFRHDLGFAWDPAAPAPRVAIGAERAHLSVLIEGEERRVIEAERCGDRLRMSAPLLDARAAGLTHAVIAQAAPTLALALAMAGWPLLRSSPGDDLVPASGSREPEALATRIMVWEAWERSQGWRVETPKIEGLRYPSWDELQASWLTPGQTGGAAC
ncbi:MAG: GNAT family N-acetyltransferase [Byssovorax sp.]